MEQRESPQYKQKQPYKEKVIENVRYPSKVYDPIEKLDPYKPRNVPKNYKNDQIFYQKASKTPYVKNEYDKQYKYPKGKTELALSSSSENTDSEKYLLKGPSWVTNPTNASKVINWYIQNMPQGRQTIIVL